MSNPSPPLSRPTIRAGRPRRPTSSFCAAWLSSTSGSHAVATPNGRRTRPQQSRARRRRRHRRRQFSHPRIAVRIQQSPASLPAVVHTGSDAAMDAGGCFATGSSSCAAANPRSAARFWMWSAYGCCASQNVSRPSGGATAALHPSGNSLSVPTRSACSCLTLQIRAGLIPPGVPRPCQP